MPEITILRSSGRVEVQQHDEVTLEVLQEVVGGYIEYVVEEQDGMRRIMFANENGIAEGLPPNRQATALRNRLYREQGYGETDWPLFGDVVLAPPEPDES